MLKLEIYQNFILWLGKTWWGITRNSPLNAVDSSTLYG